jgi:hypothetical protein
VAELRGGGGVSAGPPDFIGVGTHLAGTHWWFGLLTEHPGIRGPRDGDGSLHFFDRFCTQPMTDDDVAAYHARFAAPGTGLRGEWTSRYAYDAWTPPLLHRVAPDARLLILLNDPIERYRLSLAYRTLDEGAGAAPYMTDVVHRGRYGSQLRALYAHFPPERVLVLQTEACRADPLGQYRHTLEFLGADPEFVPRRLRRLARGKTGARPSVRLLRAVGVPEQLSVRRMRRALSRQTLVVPAEIWPDLRRSLRTALHAEVELAGRLVPGLDVERWPNFAAHPAAAVAESGAAPARTAAGRGRRWRGRVVAGGVALASGGGMAALAQFTDVL